MSCSSSSCSSEASLVVVDAAECNVQESEIPEINSKPESLKWERGACHEELAMEDPPWHIALLVKISCVVMFLAGIFADWLRMRGFIKVKVATDDPRHRGFAPLDDHLEAVYINHIYRKSSDVVNRPICGVPASVMRLKDRYTDDNGWTQKLCERSSHLSTKKLSTEYWRETLNECCCCLYMCIDSVADLVG